MFCTMADGCADHLDSGAVVDSGVVCATQWREQTSDSIRVDKGLSRRKSNNTRVRNHPSAPPFALPCKLAVFCIERYALHREIESACSPITATSRCGPYSNMIGLPEANPWRAQGKK